MLITKLKGRKTNMKINTQVTHVYFPAVAPPLDQASCGAAITVVPINPKRAGGDDKKPLREQSDFKFSSVEVLKFMAVGSIMKLKALSFSTSKAEMNANVDTFMLFDRLLVWCVR